MKDICFVIATVYAWLLLVGENVDVDVLERGLFVLAQVYENVFKNVYICAYFFLLVCLCR